MFEVLLQADQALASGALDQAERSYWQLIELDPTNAIAVVGLARVSMERGDRRLARTFADRALAMDPEMFVAKRILETLKGGVADAPVEEPDLPLLAAQRLEALGRRRVAAAEGGGVEARVGGGKPGKRGKEAVDEGRKPLPELPAEPPAARPQAGREAAEAAAAAAAAAAEAAPRPQVPPRPKAHQALGDRAHRNLLPEELKPRPRAEDPFAAAESAAAIEAVDETDDVVIEAHFGRAGRAPDQTEDTLGEILGSVDATGKDESIAMRVALVTDSADLEAAEMDAEASEREETELDEGVFGVAELVAADELGPAQSRRIDLDALEADLRAAELRAAQREAGEHDAAAQAATDTAAQAGTQAGTDEEARLRAAELASAELATAERASEWIAEEEPEAAELDVLGGRRELILPPAALPAALPATGEGPTEEDAEAAALSEAMAMLLGGEADGSGNAPRAGRANEATAAETRDPARRPAGGRPATSGASPLSTPENPTANDAPGEPGAGGAQPAEPDSRATPGPRRKGLLRRFRGD
jgi:hypothetical protein